MGNKLVTEEADTISTLREGEHRRNLKIRRASGLKTDTQTFKKMSGCHRNGTFWFLLVAENSELD